MIRLAPSLLALVASAALASGCDQGGGQVHGELLEVSSCRAHDERRIFAPFDLELDFLGTELDVETLTLRFAPRLRLTPPTDTLVVIVENLRDVRRVIRDEGLVTLPIRASVVHDPTEVRVGLALLETCPASRESLAGTNGTATFRSIGADKGDLVDGELTFEVVDMRTNTIVGQGFHATFDFEVGLGTPYQQFNDPQSQRH